MPMAAFNISIGASEIFMTILVVVEIKYIPPKNKLKIIFLTSIAILRIGKTPICNIYIIYKNII